MRKVSSTGVKATLSYSTLIGQLIAHRRKQLSLRQEEVAGTLAISQSAYSRVEKGETSISVGQLIIIASHIGVSPAALLDEAEDYAKLLRARGVQITDEKEKSAPGRLIALGILVPLLQGSAPTTQRTSTVREAG